MIPAQYISQRHFRALIDYARDEIQRAIGERRPLEERWWKLQRMYKGIPEISNKIFPFPGCANLVLPVGAIDSDTIYSRLMGVLFGPENLWSARALREDAVDFAPRLQEFLRWAQNAELNAYNATADFLLETCKLGTGVLKQRYRRESRVVYEFRETPGGLTERFSRQLVQDNPVLEHVSIYDFLVPAGTVEHKGAPWNAERVMLNNQQLTARARAGIYMGVERVLASLNDRGSWNIDELHRMQMFSPGRPKLAEVWEFWTNWDISGSGEPMPVVCALHLPTNTYMRVDWNPFFHQEFPFEVARYLRQEKQFYGIGVLELTEQIADETTTMHNQRIDNATLANSVMMKGRKNIGLKDDEPIFPGRWFLLDNLDDVQTLQFGRAFDTTLPNEQQLMQYSTRRTGVNDYVMGASSPAVGYATAQTNIMQHQEAAKRFDQTLREVRTAMSGSGRRLVELYQQFNTNGKEYTVLGERDGEVIRQFLLLPTELIRHSVSVELTATSAALNKDVQTRTQMILMQLVTQFYEQAFQGMMLVVNPQLPPQLRMLAQQMVLGGATMMERVLESHDMQDVRRVIPDMAALINGQGQQLAGLGVPTAPGVWGGAQPGLLGAGGQGGGPGLVQASGMGGGY